MFNSLLSNLVVCGSGQTRKEWYQFCGNGGQKRGQQHFWWSWRLGLRVEVSVAPVVRVLSTSVAVVERNWQYRIGRSYGFHFLARIEFGLELFHKKSGLYFTAIWYSSDQ